MIRHTHFSISGNTIELAILLSIKGKKVEILIMQGYVCLFQVK